MQSNFSYVNAFFSQKKNEDHIKLFYLKNSDRFYNTDKILTHYYLPKEKAFMKYQSLKICVAPSLNHLSVLFYFPVFSLVADHSMALRSYFLPLIFKECSSCIACFCLLAYKHISPSEESYVVLIILILM